MTEKEVSRKEKNKYREKECVPNANPVASFGLGLILRNNESKREEIWSFDLNIA